MRSHRMRLATAFVQHFGLTISFAFALDFSLFFWSFGQMDHAVVLWGVMFLYSFSAPFLQKAIVNQHLSVRIAYLCYILLSAALFAYVPQHIRAFNFPPATSFFIMCETMRLWMKMHSYLMVNRSVPCDGFCSNNSQPVLLMCCGRWADPCDGTRRPARRTPMYRSTRAM